MDTSYTYEYPGNANVELSSSSAIAVKSNGLPLSLMSSGQA